ncbi:MAG: hypothetical protein IIV13_08625, partial [Bacteroidaceae bacterium]|nr:hypothetical protein [Bacteroidaceae bacterium]
FCLRKSFKERFLYCVGKPTPPVSRSCSRFASAKVSLFLKPAKDSSTFFQKNVKKTRKRGQGRGMERGYTLLYILYIGGGEFQVSGLLFAYAHQAKAVTCAHQSKASQASSILREKRKQLSGFICFTQRTQRAQSFLA